MTHSHDNQITSDPMDPSLVFQFLLENGVSNSVVEQFKSHAIDSLSFGLIGEQDLQEMKITQIGLRKRLLFLSSFWRSYMEKTYPNKIVTQLYQPPNCTLNASMHTTLSNGMGKFSSEHCIDDNTLDPNNFQSRSFGSSTYDSRACMNQNFDLLKLILSGLYFFIVTGITSFIMVLAHERLPDISKYPPLPDLFLDSLPHIGWAFSAAEWVGVVLSILWLIILIFHRYRCILLRRFFALTGTVFLLRSFTMIITSLSVPGQHLAEQCSPFVVKDESQRIKRVFEVWFGLGMTISGIQTCGDYMFSGHTACLTLLNFFITEYAPRRFQFIHTFSWVLNLFGIFFILASHEHYSIDVFVAIYVSSRLFLYYHCLANSNILDLPDHERTMIWFPMFSFLEYDVRGIVPNEYEIPFKTYFNSTQSADHEFRPESESIRFVPNMESERLLTSTTIHESYANNHQLDGQDVPDISGDCFVQCRS